MLLVAILKMTYPNNSFGVVFFQNQHDVCSKCYKSHLESYSSIIVNVENPKYLLEIFLWCTIGHYVENDHELAEVYGTILNRKNILAFKI